MAGPQGINWRAGEGSGYPFGQRQLVLRSIKSRLDIDLACAVDGDQGVQVGTVRTINRTRWQKLAQFTGGGITASWEFEVCGVDGARTLTVRRPVATSWRDSRERFELRDAAGQLIGQLVQNNSVQTGLRTFDLQADEAVLGHTTLDYKRVGGTFGRTATHTVTIHDSSGRVVAGITQRNSPCQFVGNDFYDYLLTFDAPLYEPMGSLCFGVALSEFFYLRVERGGTLRLLPRT